MDRQQRFLRAPVRTGLLAASLAALIAGGCTGSRDVVSRTAERHGMTASLFDGGPFRHAVYEQFAGADDSRLALYFDGDGRPWLDGRRIARDPTTRDPVALELMAALPGNAAYVGRPCYGAVHGDAACRPELWTGERYSPEVVRSMAGAANAVIRRRAAAEVVLVGYSGGGALALLVAPLIPETNLVVTIGANVDVDGWARAHGYLRLTGSSNPAAMNDWPRQLVAVNLVGADDEVVPVALARQASDVRPEWNLVVLPGFDHRCCWVAAWPRLFRELARDHAPSPITPKQSGSPAAGDSGP